MRRRQKNRNKKHKMQNELDQHFHKFFKLTKKPIYALKTPRVVELPFIYGVEYIITGFST